MIQCLDGHLVCLHPLFFNKINPEVKWASPGCGKVKDIVYGPRRVIEKIEIELDKDQNSIDYKTYTREEISNLSGEQVLENILNVNKFYGAVFIPVTFHEKSQLKVARKDISPLRKMF